MTRTPDRTDKLEAAHAEMVRGIESLVTGEDWARMLEVASRFHCYSFGNVAMILAQRPDATRVAGYKTWQSLGRQVRKGERGIMIMAPCGGPCKACAGAGSVDGMTCGRCAGAGRWASFTTTHVFDLAQTDGDELPAAPVHLLDGDGPEGLWEGLARMVKDAGFELGICWSDEASRQLIGSANGQTNFAARTVTIRHGLSDAQRCKTLAHELAHVMLHDGAVGCRGRAEVEAESVAHLVCQSAGLETDSYSFGYVASWADGDVKKVTETGQRVILTARAILDTLNGTEES